MNKSTEADNALRFYYDSLETNGNQWKTSFVMMQDKEMWPSRNTSRTTTLRGKTECSTVLQLTKIFEVGFPRRIRTYSLSFNIRNAQKSKGPIWCLLQEKGNHSCSLGCTQCCTQYRLLNF
jgi:hypothetical protein